MKKGILFVVAFFGMASVASAQDVDAAKLWKDNKCNSCHGDTGKADTKMGQSKKIADMTTADYQKKYTDDQMKKSIMEGIERKDGDRDVKMKKFDKLSAAEVDALVKLVRSFGPKA